MYNISFRGPLNFLLGSGSPTLIHAVELRNKNLDDLV